MAHLSQYMSPLWQPFNDALAQIRSGLVANGTSPDRAVGVMYTMFIKQSAVLAYMDVFALCAIMAFCVVPLAFLFSSKKAVAPAGGGAH
jgi:DHA2 family multidrug resistance protein